MKTRLSMKATTTAGGVPEWRLRLRDALNADAAADADALSVEETLAMRRAIVAAVRDVPPAIEWWRPLAIAATVLLMIAVGASAGRRLEVRPPVHAGPAEPTEPAGGGQLQLQFATPGGTRIIWVFNSDLDLKATLP